MKGIIDNESGATLNRVLERLMDRGRPGVLNLISQPDGRHAVLEMGEDEVRTVSYEKLSGDEAIKAINQVSLWSFEFVEARSALAARGPKILRPIVRSSPSPTEDREESPTPTIRPAPGLKRPTIIRPLVSQTESEPRPEPLANSIPEPAPAAEPKQAEPVASAPAVAATVLPEIPASGIPTLKLAFDGTAFTPASFATDEQEFLKNDFYYLYHQAKTIGACVGLTHLQALAYTEHLGVRNVAYRPTRGAAFQASVAETSATALQMLSTI